jgi:hypothetical protein
LTARFVPSCESLETRLTPAVNIAEINGHMLLIDGSVDAEQVAITDDGYGNVTVSAGVGGATLGTFDGIDKITVRLREGADSFEYVRGGTVVAAVMPVPPHVSMKLKVDLGWGADEAAFDLSAGLDHEKVRINVIGSADNDAVHADIGSVNESTLLMRGSLGWGDDTFHASIDGDLTGESLLGLDISGGVGHDRIEVQNNDVDVGEDSVLGLYLQGSHGDDVIAVEYTGTNAGGIGLLVTGGVGKDTLNAEFSFDAGATTGQAALGTYAGWGDDTVTMSVVATNHLAQGFYLIHGGDGNDTGITTPEVFQLSIENTSLPPPL